MKSIELLPEIAERALADIEATPEMWRQINQKANASKAKSHLTLWQRPVWQYAAGLIVILGLVIGLAARPWSAQDPSITSMPAGEGRVDSGALTADLSSGSVSISGGKQSRSTSLFEDDHALLLVGSAAYRLLKEPASLQSSLLGDTLGTVTEYNVEPVLSQSGIVSNAAELGETVYAVKGFKGALAAAKVNGTMRLFQRVSYGGRALNKGENLKSTLCDASQVAAIHYGGKTVSGAADVKKLMNALFEGDYSDAGFRSGASLQLELKNGLTLQLLVKDDSVSACGTWSCPDFFELWETM